MELEIHYAHVALDASKVARGYMDHYTVATRIGQLEENLKHEAAVARASHEAEVAIAVASSRLLLMKGWRDRVAANGVHCVEGFDSEIQELEKLLKPIAAALRGRQ